MFVNYQNLGMESNIIKKLKASTKSLDDFFETKFLEFESSRTGTKEMKPLIVVKDLTSFLCHVHDQRNLDFSQSILKIGIDSGANSFKGPFTVLIFDI